MRTQSTPPATTDPPAAFISQRKKQPALALTGDGIQNVQMPIPLMLSTEAMHVNSLDESRMRMSFGAYAWIEKNAQRRKRRKSCRVKSKIHRRAPIAGISQDAVIKLLPEPLHGIYIDKAMAQDSNGLSASIFFGAVRRGVELGVFPEILGTSPEDTFELTAERSKLFMRPTADRRRQQELPVLPKATALSMAALAFERATEDLDEESSHLESSALNSPRSNQGSIADLRAWDQQHDDLSMKNVPMEAQSPSEAQLLPGRKFPPQQQDDVAISTRKEATTLLPEPSIVQPEHTSPRVLSRDAMALASAAMEEPPPAPAKYPHLEAGGISSDSSSDELEWGEQQESLVAVESKKVGGSHFDEHSKKRVKAMRLKAAARRAKAELHAAATAAKTTAGREEESERLSFLGLATDHDKHNVQQPLIARQILTQASIASPTTARGSGFVIRHAARILDAAAALEEFSISISNYAIMLQNQGRTVDVWYKLERSADQNNYTRKQEDTARAKHHAPSVVERGLAMVYYHRSLFQTAMAFRLREEPNMYTNQDECSKKETDRVTQELDSSAVVLPRLVTSHASTAKSSPCSPNIKGGNQDPVHLAISNLFDFSSEAGSQRARLSRKAKVRPRTTLSPPRTRDARFSTEALHCLGLGDLTEALGENPDLVDARLARAELHISGGNNAFALADLNAVLKRAPHCVEARINRAVLSLNLHQSVIEARADLDDAVSALALRHKTAKGRSPGHSEDAVSDSARPIPRPTTTRVCLALALCCNRCLRVKRTHTPDPSRYNRAICFAIASDFNKSQADFSRSMDLLSPALSKDRASQLTILEKNFGRRSSTGETHQRMALRILASALVPEPRDCWREEM